MFFIPQIIIPSFTTAFQVLWHCNTQESQNLILANMENKGKAAKNQEVNSQQPLDS